MSNSLIPNIDQIRTYLYSNYPGKVWIESNFTDNKYGWTNVADGYIEWVRNGYSIKLPRPREI